jgi:adenine phosphoribosyltransferase
MPENEPPVSASIRAWTSAGGAARCIHCFGRTAEPWPRPSEPFPPEAGSAAPRWSITWVDGHADVWRLFQEPAQLREITEALVGPFRGQVTKVAGIESRGFILGTAASLLLDVGFVPIRKGNGLFPGPKLVVEAAADYRGNHHTLRMQRSAVAVGDLVLLVDDWIETGNQARAARSLIEQCGARLAGVATIASQLAAGDGAELGRLHALIRPDQLGG